jgi:flagellar basal-body rod protein FlgC
MALIPALDACASALSAERMRLNVIANNIANAQTTRGVDGQPYRRQQVVFESFLDEAKRSNPAALEHAARGVRVADVVDDTRPMSQIYIPGHPDADDKGMVTMPNVNVIEEMVDMMTAQRSFEANVQVVQVSRQMFGQALSITQQT